MDLCWQAMSLLFNMLSRLVTTFLPRSKHLLISWLQPPFAVILEPPKIKVIHWTSMANRWGNSGNSGWFFFWGAASKITDCRHEIKRRLTLDRKAMTNPDSILRTRHITLPTKVCLVKAMVFPVIMYGCESWTIKKAECWRIDAFKLWCWRRLLGVPWTARRISQSILKEISPEYSLEGLKLKLKL